MQRQKENIQRIELGNSIWSSVDDLFPINAAHNKSSTLTRGSAFLCKTRHLNPEINHSCTPKVPIYSVKTLLSPPPLALSSYGYSVSAQFSTRSRNRLSNTLVLYRYAPRQLSVYAHLVHQGLMQAFTTAAYWLSNRRNVLTSNIKLAKPFIDTLLLSAASIKTTELLTNRFFLRFSVLGYTTTIPWRGVKNVIYCLRT